MALAPDAGESWLAQGGYRAITGDLEGALAAYQEAQKRMPNNATVYLRMGFNQRSRCLWRDAEASLNKAVELDPRNVPVLVGMVEVYGYLRRYDEGLRLAERAIAIGPEFDSTRSSKANLLRKAGRLAEAGDELKRIPTDSTDRWALESRAEQATYERRPEEAHLIAALILTLQPGRRGVRERVVLTACAYCLLDAGRMDEAKDIFRRVLDEESATGNPDLDNVAAAHAGLNQKDEAIDAARRLVSKQADGTLFKQDAEIRLAMTQARLGEKEAALAVLPHLLEVPGPLSIADLKFNPAWDSLRDDPRFQKLLNQFLSGHRE